LITLGLVYLALGLISASVILSFRQTLY
jgi:hypothetical protein